MKTRWSSAGTNQMNVKHEQHAIVRPCWPERNASALRCARASPRCYDYISVKVKSCVDLCVPYVSNSSTIPMTTAQGPLYSDVKCPFMGVLMSRIHLEWSSTLWRHMHLCACVCARAAHNINHVGITPDFGQLEYFCDFTTDCGHRDSSFMNWFTCLHILFVLLF